MHRINEVLLLSIDDRDKENETCYQWIEIAKFLAGRSRKIVEIYSNEANKRKTVKRCYRKKILS